MDRVWAGTNGASDLSRRSPSEDFALPSRGEAIVAVRPAIEAQVGPVLMTGEAGVGKTWLWRRLQSEMSPNWRWSVLDVPPVIDPAALYHLIGHGLGLPASAVADEARLALADFLREANADGVRWALVLDEAHNGSAMLFEEVRLLANRLGRPDGFSAMLLVGQTSLACRLATRPLKSLAVRLAAHVHLRCLDVAEARALLNCLLPTLGWDEPTLERHHRDAGGNPRGMLLAARYAIASPGRRLLERPRTDPTLPPVRPRLATDAADNPREIWGTPIVGPMRPPLRVGDGMIEVGWEPSPDAGAEAGAEPGSTTAIAPSPLPVTESIDAPVPPVAPVRSPMVGRPHLETDPDPEPEPETDPETETVEPIEDHYAALQAWNDRSRNQDRVLPAGTRDDTMEPVSPAGGADLEADVDPLPDMHGQPHPSVWIEGQHGFAPYGQLFSRLRQARDANEAS